MRVLAFVFGFVGVVCAAVTALGLALTGGLNRQDVTMMKEGMGKAYVAGLKDVEQTARRMRGDYCAAEQPVEGADCGG